MTIDPNEEAIIDSETTNEEEVELDVEEETEVETEEDKEVEKPIETPEAKRARLKRQLDQHDKKHGFKDTEVKVSAKANDLSTKDVLYLAKAEIHEEDMDEVLETAKARGWDVKKAHEYLKPILAQNAEFRKTSEGTNTGTNRRGSVKVTDEALLSNANSGKLPESDSEIERLVSAKMAQK